MRPVRAEWSAAKRQLAQAIHVGDVMDLTHLPYDAPLTDYVTQAAALYVAWEAGDEKRWDCFGPGIRNSSM